VTTLNDDQQPLRTLEAIRVARVVAIVRAAEPGRAYPMARELIAAGVTVIEVSLTTPDAWEVLGRLAAEAEDGPVEVGAGTVLAPGDARRAAGLGARFVLSPVLDLEVVESAAGAGLLAIPGCATPSEMHQAMRGGAGAVKIFPASLWSPEVLRDLLRAMPDLRCVPTGGIGLADAPGWLAAGAIALGLGSALTSLAPARLADTISALRSGADGQTPGEPIRPAAR
jgi:2-dehydro-3-deoxyphosphogluconate aldolase / (4S)-4-hydroxy-2-oxoglutarate aldolase